MDIRKAFTSNKYGRSVKTAS